jgi:hypothetical protein
VFRGRKLPRYGVRKVGAPAPRGPPRLCRADAVPTLECPQQKVRDFVFPAAGTRCDDDKVYRVIPPREGHSKRFTQDCQDVRREPDA